MNNCDLLGWAVTVVTLANAGIGWITLVPVLEPEEENTQYMLSESIQ